jgi:uncharacterized protein DUF1707
MIDSTCHVSADAPATALDLVSSSVRASHAERAATVERLHAALGEGRLELDETEERVAAAYGSSYRSDLVALLADLPAAEPRGLRAGWAQVWQAIVRQAWVSLARVRGTQPTDPSRGQQRAVTVVLVAGVLWVLLCLLVGFSVGLFS